MQRSLYGLLVGSASLALFGCAQLPTNIDLSSLLASEQSRSNPHRSKDSESDQRFAQARRAEENGDTGRAITQYTKITEDFPDHSDALHRLAVLHDTHGDADASSRLFLRAMHFAPKDADLLNDYGYSRYIHGDSLQAETMLRRVIDLAPNHRRAHTNLALVLARQGKPEQALASFQRAGLSREEAAKNLQRALDMVRPKDPPPTNHAVKENLTEEELLEALTESLSVSESEYVADQMRDSLRRN